MGEVLRYFIQHGEYSNESHAPHSPISRSSRQIPEHILISLINLLVSWSGRTVDAIKRSSLVGKTDSMVIQKQKNSFNSMNRFAKLKRYENKNMNVHVVPKSNLAMRHRNARYPDWPRQCPHPLVLARFLDVLE